MGWLQRLWSRRHRYDELSETIREHLDEKIADLMDRGMTRDEAEQTARREFGNVTRIEERSREVWQWSWLDSLARDLRISCRTLLRSPEFSIVAIAVLGLCIGATTSLFTVVRSVLLRPLPFQDPDHLVMLFEHFRDPSMNAQGFNYNSVAPADYYDWRAKTHGFEDMAAWRYWQFNLTGKSGELPEIVQARGGTWNLFPLLGVNAAVGRTFTESEDRLDGNTVLFTWSLFERRFGGDRSIVGKQIHLDGKPYTVVGVLPEWFIYPDAKVQLWVPYLAGLPPEVLPHHDFHFTRVVARLRPDVSLANALSQVGAVQYHEHMENLHAPVAEDVASKTLLEDLAQGVKKPLIILMSAVCCVLLIGCLNVANLLVARSAVRQKEIAIRSALGARRMTLIRVQLIESLLVSFAGGVAGVALSLTATRWLAATWKNLPSALSIRVDGTVLAFACGIILAASLLAGLLPSISSTAKGAIAALQPSSRSTAGGQARPVLRKALLMVEIAATVVLLIAAGLLLKSFWLLRTTDVGSVTENVLTMSYSLPGEKYSSPDKLNAFNEALLERVRAMPGVHATGLGTAVPGAGEGEDDAFTIPEHPPIPSGTALPDALYRAVDPGYFSALEIPLLRGRFFSSQDRAGRPKAVIINHLLAQEYFPNENPLGKHLHLVPYGNADHEVVGVVADTLYQVGQPAKPAMYFPVLNGNSIVGWLTLVVRAESDPLSLSVPIQKQIAALDPELPVSDVLTMQQIIAQSVGNASLSATLVLAFAVLSLLLASVGLYGVLSYLATQRTSEIGVRMALGARRGQVLRLMLGDGLRPVFYGLLLGVVAGAAAVRLIESMLYQTPPFDPTIFAAVALTLFAVAALACIGPAWRASRIDPMQALRFD